MTKKDIFETAYDQLAIDYNARPEDFRSEGIIFTEAARLPGRRDYTGAEPFLELATTGHSTVVMAEKRLHPALREWALGAEEPHWLLEFPRLMKLADINKLYPNEKWPNALHSRESYLRPDVLALAALDGGRTAGMAGASADAPGVWQIGIDVLPEYRGRGLGRLLVSGLASEVRRRGAAPFYYTSLSNIHSQNIAISCGFRLAWVDVSAEKGEAL